MVHDKVRLCIVAALACGPLPAWAQGAEEIRFAMQAWVDGQLAAMDGTEVEATASGPVAVVPDGGGFAVEIPAFDVRMADGASFTIDPVPIDLEPLENGWFDTSWRLPDEIVIYDAAGAETARLGLAGQSGEGVFAPEIRNFMSMRFALDGVTLTTTHDESGFTIDRLTGDFAYDETAPGIYDQPGAFAIDGLQVTGPAGLALVDIGRLTLTTAAGGVHLAEMAAFGQALEEAMAGLDDLPPETARAEAASRMAALLEQTPDLLSSLEFSYDLNDLAVANGDFGVVLPSADFGMRASGLDTPTTRIRLTLGFDDMAIDPPPTAAQLVPTAGQIDLAFVDLPTDAFVEAMIGVMEAGATPPTQGDQAATAAFFGLQEAIGASGSRLVLDTLTLGNAIASLAFEGELKADAASALGFQGSGTAIITGLPEMVQQVQSVPEAEDALGLLIVLQGMGTPEPAADGGTVFRYDLEVTPAGEVLVNGVDMAGLAGAAGNR